MGDFTASIVRILKPNGETSGTGFVLTDDGLIATCAHVIKSAGAEPGDTVRLVFHHTGDETTATVEPDGWRDPDAEDVAFLRPDGTLPERVRPLPLGHSTDTANHPFETFGFPEINPDEGLWGTGHILRQTTLGGMQVLQLQSQEVTPGFSGAPIWDTTTQRVVGMVTAITNPDDYGRLGETAFAAPIKTLLEIWPSLPIILAPHTWINTVPPLPDHFVERPVEFDQLVAHLLSEVNAENTVAITTALQGGGGFGKTTLAQAICHHPQIQAIFTDGVLWIELGQTPNLMGVLIDQISVLSEEKPNFTDINLAAARLRELLANRRMLLVLDDVWDDNHTRLFLSDNVRYSILITTRRQDIATRLKAWSVTVNEMTSGEATDLLVKWLDTPPTDRQPIRDLAQYLGEWPLLLKLAGAYLRELVELDQQPLELAITSLRQRLERRGFTYLDRIDEGKRNEAIGISLGLSLERLSKWRERYLELAIFPEDTDIPFVTIEKLWGQTADLYELDAEDALRAMQRLSLFTRYDTAKKTIRLHNVIRNYLANQQDDNLSILHTQFLNAHFPQEPNSKAGILYFELTWADLPPDEPYLWDHLAYHLITAQRGDELVATLKNLHYLVSKTFHRNTYSVELDFLAADQYHSDDDQLQLLKHHFILAGPLLEKCKISPTSKLNDLIDSLRSRLYHLDALANLAHLLETTLTRPYLMPHHPLPDLPHPALLRSLAGHTSSLTDCAYSPDGQHTVSASMDNTVRVWNAQTGQILLILTGHEDMVNSCAYSPDGKHIVSASQDKTLKIWNAQTGQEILTLAGHTERVFDCAYSPDGQHIVSASQDKTLKIWNAQTGQEILTLTGHTDTVGNCAYSPDGQWIVSTSWSKDNTLKVWNAQTGQEILTLAGHTDIVTNCAYSPDGKYIVSASRDKTLKIWNAQTGQEILKLTSPYPVLCCAYSPDGRYIVSDSGLIIKVWDAQTGQDLLSLNGHTSSVISCAYRPDGRQIISASFDSTLRIWDAKMKQIPLTRIGHTSTVVCCAYSPDETRVVSGSTDNTLKIWDTQTGQDLLTLTGHTSWVSGCAYSPGGQHIVSTSRDKTLRVWNARNGQEVLVLPTDNIRRARGNSSCAYSPDGQCIVYIYSDNILKVYDNQLRQNLFDLVGHEDIVLGCAYSPDGQYIVSTSADKTLKIWSAHTGEHVHTLIGHTMGVSSCAYSPDGQHIVSASMDNTLKIWNAHTGQKLRTFIGHTDWVRCCTYDFNGQLLASVSMDQTLRIWEADTGQNLATLAVDSALNTCIWSKDGVHIVAVGDGGVYFLQFVK